ncbi:hypothetical protein O181_046047 [Austropuccinia psidii MF-1]|uniref:Uncharacterized protein n=1 Tax=Austropuccinia psidii MF-1 TaxID=1389203 RepID=A0A9Q3DQH9_9BASI|nr:hypothetical protein [Austropuccinia psidii MF-1]
MNLLYDLVTAPEALDNLHEAFANTTSTVNNLWSVHFHKKSNAMDSRMTTDANFQIWENEVLQVAQRFQKHLAPSNTSATNPISLMAASGSHQQSFNQNPPVQEKSRSN